MKNKPEIIKELIKLEKIGKLKCSTDKIYEQINNNNLLYQESESIKILDSDLKKIKKEYDFDNFEKKYYEDIFNITSDFLIYIENGIILDINKTAMKLSGFSKEETIGKTFLIMKNIFSDEDLKKHFESINLINSGKKVQDYEVNLKANNNTLNFIFTVDCVRDQKEIKGILIRGKDITQRQKAWDELVKLEERYRILAETSADGVITVDSLGRLTYVNPSFEKMCERRKSQILATLFRNYLSDDSVYLLQQVLIDVRKNNEKIENVELELIHANGNIIPIEVNLAPFRKQDEFVGIVCTIRDITEHRRIEDEFKKSEKLRTEFMNIAAHELKSPVTPIKGYLELIISDKNVNRKVKNWAKISLRNTDRLLRLINDILDVSRLDTDTMRFEMEKLNIIELLNEIVEDMRAPIENKNLKFIADIPKELPSMIGDKIRLSQVFKNLLVNSIKFTDNGSITIKAEKKDNYLIISVIDTGCGIPQDKIKKLFNKFYQVYTGNDRKSEGTGLGLFICKQIIKKHNGEIGVESTFGIGSTFYTKLKYLKN